MKRNTWDINTLKDRFNTISKLLHTEKDPKKRDLLENDYLTLLNHFDEYYSHPEDKLKLLENYQYMKDTYKTFSFLWDDFKYTNDLVLPPQDILELKKQTLSRNDIFDITHDFYKSLDDYFYKFFYEIFKQRKTNVTFKPLKNYSTYDGLSISLPSLNEYFIEILRKNNLNDLFTSIHEYSHCLSVSINHDHLNYPKSIYSEIDSLFMELIATDYLKDLLKDDDTTIITISKFDDIFSFSEEVSDRIDLVLAEEKLGKKITSNKVLKQLAKDNCDLYGDEVEELLDSPDYYSVINLISYMIAIELYMIYQKDKEKALYMLKKIILLENLSAEQYYNSIKKLGITPNYSFQEFQQKYYQEYTKLTRKRSKE